MWQETNLGTHTFNVQKEDYLEKAKRVWITGEDSILNRSNRLFKTFQDRPLSGFEQSLTNAADRFYDATMILPAEDEAIEKTTKGVTNLARRVGVPDIGSQIAGGTAGLLVGMLMPGPGEAKAAANLTKLRKLAAKADADIIKRQQLNKSTSSRIDPDEMLRRQTLEPAGFKMNRKEIKAEIVKLQDKGMSLEDAKKQLLGDGETFWIDNRTGEPISIQYNSKDPNKPHMVGWWSRGKRGGKRTLLTEQQSVGPGETAFTKYNAKTNKVELLVKKGDEIHHWNSIIDKSSAYVGLNTQEAKELTGLVREAGWMFGDNKANLIKMVRSDHKKIHAFMRENGIEGVSARKMMEKLYAGKSVEDRFKILRGFMEHVQGAVDEELVRMGYQVPPSHAAAQAANREVLKTIRMP